jgi:hypothetical protein
MIINKKLKKSKRVGIWGLESESVKWAVLDHCGLYSSHPYPPSGRYIGAPSLIMGWVMSGSCRVRSGYWVKIHTVGSNSGS